MAIWKGIALLAVPAIGLGAVPALGEKPALMMLDRLDRGSWELREAGSSAAGRRICLDNGRELIQLRHAQLSCRQVIINDQPNEITVQYTCPGRGYGRTHVRRETDSLIQLDSQGIANGQPFAFTVEGRRVGGCAP